MSQMDFNPEEILATDVPQIVNTNEPHMACLFLVDTSGSMVSGVDENGNKVVPIKELNDALNRFKDEVCKDEKTKDILDIAVIEFNTNHKIVQEFTPIEYMQPVNFVAGGGTYMVDPIEEAIKMVDERSRFYRRMGTEPYKPWIVMITDGEPLDNVDAIAQKVNQLAENGKLAFWTLCVPGANPREMHKISGKRVLNLAGYDFSGFFDWVNKSMRAVSQSSPGEKVKGQELPPSTTIDDLM